MEDYLNAQIASYPLLGARKTCKIVMWYPRDAQECTYASTSAWLQGTNTFRHGYRVREVCQRMLKGLISFSVGLLWSICHTLRLNSLQPAPDVAGNSRIPCRYHKHFHEHDLAAYRNAVSSTDDRAIETEDSVA